MAHKQFIPKRFKPGTFIHSSYYVRGGSLKDKHGNKQHTPLTFRNNHSGVVVNIQGRPIGVERARHHTYGSDPRKAKIVQTPQQRAIMANLRRRRR